MGDWNDWDIPITVFYSGEEIDPLQEITFKIKKRPRHRMIERARRLTIGRNVYESGNLSAADRCTR